MPLKTYRYAVCGGSNFTSSDRSLLLVYPITLISGFLLNKYITFTTSNLKSLVQLKRYIMVSLGSLFIVYFLMKIFVDVVGIYPTPAKILTTILAVIYSYILQNKFSFKTLN